MKKHRSSFVQFSVIVLNFKVQRLLIGSARIATRLGISTRGEKAMLTSDFDNYSCSEIMCVTVSLHQT